MSVAVSSKVYPSLGAGQPVLDSAEPDDGAEIVRRSDANGVVQQGDAVGIVEGIEEGRASPELVAEEGEYTRRALEEHLGGARLIDRNHVPPTAPVEG